VCRRKRPTRKAADPQKLTGMQGTVWAIGFRASPGAEKNSVENFHKRKEDGKGDL